MTVNVFPVAGYDGIEFLVERLTMPLLTQSLICPLPLLGPGGECVREFALKLLWVCAYILGECVSVGKCILHIIFTMLGRNLDHRPLVRPWWGSCPDHLLSSSGLDIDHLHNYVIMCLASAKPLEAHSVSVGAPLGWGGLPGLC